MYCSLASLYALNILFLHAVNAGLLMSYESNVFASGSMLAKYLSLGMTCTPPTSRPFFIMYMMETINVLMGNSAGVCTPRGNVRVIKDQYRHAMSA